MARPARAREVADTFFRRSAVEEVSAVCSRARRESWLVAKVWGDIPVDVDGMVEDVARLWGGF